jgi:cell division protein FtsQ
MTTTVRLPRVRDDSPAGGEDGRDAHPRRRAVVAAVAAAVLVGAAIWVVGFSPVFGVRTVSVRGASPVTAQQIRAAAHVRHGSPVLRLDTGAIARRIEHAVPSVATAWVRTSFPSTVVITVTERVPMGYLTTGNSYVLVDAAGDQFATVTKRPRNLPLFAVPTGQAGKATGAAVASVAAALPPAVRTHVASIQAIDPSAITLLLTDQRVVTWGSAQDNAAKARVLPALLAQKGTRFDVSDPNLVVAH